MIIWLASYPRSGNSYTRVLLENIYGLPKYALYDTKTTSSVRDLLPAFAISPEIHVVKTHELPEEDYPAIYLLRDGRDAIVSYTHFLLTNVQKIPIEHQAPYFEKTMRTVIKGQAGFGRWSTHVEAWTTRKSQTAILRYEDLITRPVECIREAIVKLHLNLTEIGKINLPTFDELKQKEPNDYRRGQIGSWQDEMPERLRRLFWRYHGKTMIRQGYMPASIQDTFWRHIPPIF